MAITALRAALQSETPDQRSDPPWGAALLAFLHEHRAVPAAAAELDRVPAAWLKVVEGVRGWVLDNVTDVAPAPAGSGQSSCS